MLVYPDLFLIRILIMTLRDFVTFVKKKGQSQKKQSLVLSPTAANQNVMANLIAVSASLTNVILSRQSGISQLGQVRSSA